MRKILIILLIGMLFFLPLVSAALSGNVKFYWKFDENTGTVTEEFVGGIENVTTVSTGWNTDGKINSGYKAFETIS